MSRRCDRGGCAVGRCRAARQICTQAVERPRRAWQAEQPRVSQHHGNDGGYLVLAAHQWLSPCARDVRAQPVQRHRIDAATPTLSPGLRWKRAAAPWRGRSMSPRRIPCAGRHPKQQTLSQQRRLVPAPVPAPVLRPSHRRDGAVASLTFAAAARILLLVEKH